MMFIYFCVSICVLICLLIFCYFHFGKVKMGPPPVKRLLIAYKYSYRNYKHHSAFKELKAMFPNSNLVKFSYCGVKADHMEYANGVVLRENSISVDSALLEATFRKGYSLFITPEISHSVYTEVPASKWLSLSYVVALLISYPRIFSFIKKNSLCGYPVMEIYKKRSISVIVPLVRQDEFVVHEALNVVHGYRSSALLRPLNPLPMLNYKQNGHANGHTFKQNGHTSKQNGNALKLNGHTHKLNGHTNKQNGQIKKQNGFNKSLNGHIKNQYDHGDKLENGILNESLNKKRCSLKQKG